MLQPCDCIVNGDLKCHVISIVMSRLMLNSVNILALPNTMIGFCCSWQQRLASCRSNNSMGTHNISISLTNLHIRYEQL